MIPAPFLAAIRDRVAVSKRVSQKLKLLRAGREYKACCPFHNEKTPSFYVNDDKQFFHCHGCGAHGDVISWVMRAEHLSFPEAVESLASEAGLDVPRLGPVEREKAERAKSLGQAVEAACVWFQAKLWAPEGRAALAYLRGRGLTDDTIERFRLGFAPDGWRNLAPALKAQGFEEAMLLEAGLVGKPEDKPDPFDFFRNRVMFPITDRRGRVIAFGGRVMDDSKPKYLNSRDTPLFHKRGNLYALDKARLGVGERKARALVAEGYMDVIALHQAGFEGAVAPLGTALTEEQLEALWRIHAEPVVCLDGDAAGQRAALKAAETALPLLKPGRALRFVALPPEDDPDSQIKREGPGAFAALLDRTETICDVLWRAETLGKPLDTADRKAALEGRIRAHLSRIADATVRRAYESDLIWERCRKRPPKRPFVPAANRRIQMPALKSPMGAAGDKNRVATAIAAILAHHPALSLEHEDAIACVDFGEGAASRVVAACLSWSQMEEAAGHDVVASRFLISHPDIELLVETVTLSPYALSYDFCRRDADVASAKAGFLSLIGLFSRDRVEMELRAAISDLPAEPDAKSLRKIDALTQVLRDIRDGEDGASA